MSFDSHNREWGEAPTRLSGIEMRRQLDDILTEYKVEDLIKRRMEKRKKKRGREKTKVGRKVKRKLLGRRKAFFGKK